MIVKRYAGFDQNGSVALSNMENSLKENLQQVSCLLEASNELLRPLEIQVKKLREQRDALKFLHDQIRAAIENLPETEAQQKERSEIPF